MHKAGFVNIIGLPNVGKSTLMNALIGEKLSITSSKAQTTRHRIFGIFNDDEYQIVFSDTPGFIRDPAYPLQKHMNEFVSSTFEDADLFLYVADPWVDVESQQALIDRVLQTKLPLYFVMSKGSLVDAVRSKEVCDLWVSVLNPLTVYQVDSVTGAGIEALLLDIKKHIPEHEPYFDKEDLTDRNVRFFVSEIIREHILKLYRQEIPYSCEVVVEDFKEKPDIISIRALIYTERDSQKNIIIGPKGSSIQQLGIDSRVAIEAFLGKKVYLDLFVKVLKEWRSNALLLSKLGYKN